MSSEQPLGNIDSLCNATEINLHASPSVSVWCAFVINHSFMRHLPRHENQAWYSCFLFIYRTIHPAQECLLTHVLSCECWSQIYPLSPHSCLPYRLASCRHEMILVYILSADTSQDIASDAGHHWRYNGYSSELFMYPISIYFKLGI